jgi:MFS family permease
MEVTMDVWMQVAYLIIGLGLSVFYGRRAAWITREAPPLERLHQVWFNFAGSALGWLIGYWVWQRFSGSQSPIGLMEAALMIFAALGVVGYLPQTLNALPGLLIYLGKLAERKLQEPLGPSDAATQRRQPAA